MQNSASFFARFLDLPKKDETPFEFCHARSSLQQLTGRRNQNRNASKLKRNPTEYELYEHTHLNSDGSWVHSRAEHFALDYQNILTDPKQQQSLVADETNPIAEESHLMVDRIQGHMQSLDNEIRAKGGLKDQLVEIKSLLQLSLSFNGLFVQPPPYVPAPIAQPVGGAFDNGGGPFLGFGFSQFSHAPQQQGLRASHINDVSFTHVLLQPQPNQGRDCASRRTRDVTHSS